MAKELPFARSYSDLIGSRFTASVYGHFRSLLDTVIPVQVLGHTDFSNIERPSWGIACFAEHLVAPRYVTASITSAVDISIEGIGWEYRDNLGVVSASDNIVGLTPPSTWIPFSAGPVFWTPGIRPLLTFDQGRTIVITGRQPNPPPYWGLELWQNLVLDSGYGIAVPELTWHQFSPPIILPAGLFFTLSASATDRQLWSSWRYREIG